MNQSSSSPFSFDRIVGLVIIALLLAILGLIWQNQAPDLASVAGQSTNAQDASQQENQQYIVYTAVDEQGLEQLYATPLEIRANGIITGERKQLSHEAVGVWDFAPAPTANRILYSALTAKGTADLWLTTPLSPTATLLVPCPDGACGSAAWSPDGRLLAYSRRNATVGGAATLNPPRLWMIDTVSGESAAVFSDNQKLAFEPRWSSDGKWISYLSPDFVGVGVMNLDDGNTQFFATPSGEPAVWRPGKSEIMLTTQVQTSENWATHLVLVDVATGSQRNLSGEQVLVEDSSPIWSGDGEWLVFRRRIIEGAGKTLSKQLWRMKWDGSEAQPLTNDPNIEHGFVSLSPDSRYVVFHRFPLKGPNLVISVWVLDLQTGQQIEIASPGQRPQWLP